MVQQNLPKSLPFRYVGIHAPEQIKVGKDSLQLLRELPQNRKSGTITLFLKNYGKTIEIIQVRSSASQDGFSRRCGATEGGGLPVRRCQCRVRREGLSI